MVNSIKCVVTGDGTVGKTCLLLSYAQNAFPTEYVPTVFNNYAKNLIINGQPVKLGLWDTAGQEDYDRLRILSYQKANIIMVCFAVDNPVSLNNIRIKWIPEAQKRCPQAPYIVVGTKLDMRNTYQSYPPLYDAYGNIVPQYDENGYEIPTEFVDQDQAAAAARELGASAYAECSALTQEGLKDVFDIAVRVALTKGSGNGCCVIL